MDTSHSGILDLLRKIARLASDPAAPDGERSAAAAKLRTLMQRHGLTEADLSDESPQQFHLIPFSETPQEVALAIQIVAQICNITKIRHQSTRTGRLAEFRATPAQKADILDCWQHYLPLFRATTKAMDAERKRLRQQLRDLPKANLSAFIHKFRIFPESAEDSSRLPTPAEIRRAMAARQMQEDMEGDPWTRKAGNLQQQPLLLT